MTTCGLCTIRRACGDRMAIPQRARTPVLGSTPRAHSAAYSIRSARTSILSAEPVVRPPTPPASKTPDRRCRAAVRRRSHFTGWRFLTRQGSIVDTQRLCKRAPDQYPRAEGDGECERGVDVLPLEIRIGVKDLLNRAPGDQLTNVRSSTCAAAAAARRATTPGRGARPTDAVPVTRGHLNRTRRGGAVQLPT